MPDDSKWHKHMLDALLDLEEGLTKWEVDFVESLSKWEGDFTPRQAECLEKIYDKHF